MRIINALWVAVLIVAFSVPAMAKNDVTVQGDLLRDGFLTINLDWTVDTKNYRGVPKGELRQRVKKEMYEKTLPKLCWGPDYATQWTRARREHRTLGAAIEYLRQFLNDQNPDSPAR